LCFIMAENLAEPDALILGIHYFCTRAACTPGTQLPQRMSHLQ
jgi:hypothetical protein